MKSVLQILFSFFFLFEAFALEDLQASVELCQDKVKVLVSIPKVALYDVFNKTLDSKEGEGFLGRLFPFKTGTSLYYISFLEQTLAKISLFSPSEGVTVDHLENLLNDPEKLNFFLKENQKFFEEHGEQILMDVASDLKNSLEEFSWNEWKESFLSKENSEKVEELISQKLASDSKFLPLKEYKGPLISLAVPLLTYGLLSEKAALVTSILSATVNGVIPAADMVGWVTKNLKFYSGNPLMTLVMPIVLGIGAYYHADWYVMGSQSHLKTMMAFFTSLSVAVFSHLDTNSYLPTLSGIKETLIRKDWPTNFKENFERIKSSSRDVLLSLIPTALTLGLPFKFLEWSELQERPILRQLKYMTEYQWPAMLAVGIVTYQFSRFIIDVIHKIPEGMDPRLDYMNGQIKTSQYLNAVSAYPTHSLIAWMTEGALIIFTLIFLYQMAMSQG